MSWAGFVDRWFGVERELSCLETREVRRAVLAAADLTVHRGWGLFWLRVGLGFLAALPLIVAEAALKASLHGHFWWGRAIEVAFSLPTLALIFGVPYWLYARDRQRAVREQIRAIGIQLCLRCGYNLTGIDFGRCPEFGHAV